MTRSHTFIVMIQRPRLVFFTLFTVLSIGTSGQSRVAERYVRYLGGEKKWAAIRTIVTSGEYDYGGIKFTYTAYAKAPSSYKFTVPFKGKYYAQAYDGTNGWKIDAFKNETRPSLLSGMAARDLANEADPEVESLFIRYRSKGIQLSAEPDTLIGGKAVSKIAVVRPGGDKEYYYFDQGTAALVLRKARSKNPEMNRAILTTTFSDYREFDGVKIACKIVHESNGQPILTVTVDRVTINEPIADGEFQPPP